jgi:hypothetical protein
MSSLFTNEISEKGGQDNSEGIIDARSEVSSFEMHIYLVEY